MKRGDVLPDHLEPSIDDGWIVVEVTEVKVRAVDLTSFVVWQWTIHDDGIRVARARPTQDPIKDDDDADWIPQPITRFPPPPEVEAHLRNSGWTL